MLWKVMTLNLNGYGEKHGPWSLRKSLIADAIEATSPDLVAFQAVRWDQGARVDQAGELRDLLPEYSCRSYEPAGKANGGWEGLAFLSRNGLRASSSERLSLSTGDEDRARRLVFRTVLDLPGGPLNVFGCHFSWVPEQNARNMDEARAYIERFPGPAIVMGDFNTAPDSPSLRGLLSAGLHDLWAELRPDDPGPTFESQSPDKRIDYVLATVDLRERASSIVLVGSGLETSRVRLSDHLGLIAVFDL